MKISIDVSDGKNVFFISDFHLHHKNIIKFDNRPFVDRNGEPDLPAMHRAIIDNWNRVVRDEDVVFLIGDLVFKRPQLANEVIFALNGTIHFVMGNHDDYQDIVNLKRFETVYDLVDLNIKGDSDYPNLHFAVCHYPIFSHNRMSNGSIHIYAHCHHSLTNTEFSKNRRAFDAGCNGWDYTPVPYRKFVELSEKMDFKEKSKRH